MSRLLVMAPGELTRDPRARRAALAARRFGHEVTGLCGPASDAPLELEGIRVERVGTERLGTALREAGLGGMRESRPLVQELRGVYRLVRLARRTILLYWAGVRMGRFDIVHANDLDTLPAAALLARRWSACLVYDAHEIYSRQELSPPRLFGSVALWLEGALARRAAAVVTVCEPIADELGRLLRLRRPPVVILNCPERVDVVPCRVEWEGPLRVIYQGAMGPGRALDDLFEAAEHAEGIHLTIRVVGASSDALRAEIARRGLTERVAVSAPVAPDRLVEALADFDVGLIINRPVTRNDEFVLPNKLFEYLMAGVVPAVPALPALAPIVDGERVGVTYEPGRPDLLGAALSELATDRGRVAEMGGRARRLALERFTAEGQGAALARIWEDCAGASVAGS